MSDSDDDLSSAANIPTDVQIEKGLRDVVREAVNKGEEVTIKAARTRAEERLGLDTGFLTDNAQWKTKSKDLIKAAFDEPSSPVIPKKKAPAPKAKPAAKAGTKRKSDEAQPSKKKQKKDVVKDSDDEEDSVDETSAASVEAAKTPAKKTAASRAKSDEDSELSELPENGEPPEAVAKNGKTTHVEDSESELSSVIDDPPPKKKPTKKAAPAKAAKAPKAEKPTKSKPPAEDDDSDMSVVRDDPPPKKGRKRKITSPGATSKPKAKPAASKDLSPEEEEIKRLQSYLLKCGIRKLWHRELAPYDFNKAKIKHLKSMLEEAGMTGRFSEEKAKQIKEARELKAEIEAAEEFNKQWGHEKEGSDEGSDNDVHGKGEEKEPPAGRRTKPKGFVDFGDSDEDSE